MVITQFIINTLITGSIYALIAIGFSLVYYVMKFFNFAHGGLITLSAYVFYILVRFVGIDLIYSIVITLLLSAFLGVLFNAVVYRNLRLKKTSTAMLILISFILLILFESFISLVFGVDIKLLFPAISTEGLYIFGTRITYPQVYIILASIFTFCTTIIFVGYTKIGKYMRAVADNKELAEISGINTERIFQYCFILSSLIAGISGIVVSVEKSLRPSIGSNLIIKGFAGSVAGGINSLLGSILGGYIIGFLENVGVWFLPSAYKDAITFVVLFLFLIFRPRGIFGDKA